MSEEIYTVERAAERLKLHPKTVLRLVREGRLRATRVGRAYRILRSDLEALAGMRPTRDGAALRAQVTSILEIDGLDLDPALRIANHLQAALLADQARPAATQLNTAYDPERRHLKVVAIGAPADVAALLGLVQLHLERQP